MVSFIVRFWELLDPNYKEVAAHVNKEPGEWMVVKLREKKSNSPLEPGMPNTVEAAFREVNCTHSSLRHPHRLHLDALHLIRSS